MFLESKHIHAESMSELNTSFRDSALVAYAWRSHQEVHRLHLDCEDPRKQASIFEENQRSLIDLSVDIDPEKEWMRINDKREHFDA